MIREDDYDVFNETLYETKRVREDFMHNAPELLKTGWKAYETETYRFHGTIVKYILFRRVYDIDRKLEEIGEQKMRIEEAEQEKRNRIPWWKRWVAKNEKMRRDG